MFNEDAAIDLYVFAVPGDSSDGLMDVWWDMKAGSKPAFAMHKRFPLLANPPPDTLLMRATDNDFSVFGEDLELGALQMIDHGSLVKYAHHDTLENLVHRDARATAATLTGFAKNLGVDVDEARVLEALTKGTWPTTADAMLQAAAFAHHLGDAAKIAVESDNSVVWAYQNVELEYDYP